MKEFWDSFLLGEPLWALLFLALPLLAWLKSQRPKRITTLLFPTVSIHFRSKKKKSRRWTWLPLWLRFFSLALIVLSLCRPQLDRSTKNILSSGVDIVLAVDLSASMLALDMSEDGDLLKKITTKLKSSMFGIPISEKEYVRLSTRLDTVKDVLKKFIEDRQYDRIGLVAFAGEKENYTVCPLTLDKEVLQSNLARLKVGLTEKTDTSIGSAMSEGINRLRDLESKSKILILLTDGKDSEVPENSPIIYAYGAKEDGIKIYTISIGSSTSTPTYLFNPSTRDLHRNSDNMPAIKLADYPVDKEILKEISKVTGAQSFEAKDKATLELIYDEIDRLEKSEVEMSVNALFDDLYVWPLGASIFLLCLEFILARTCYLRIP